MHLDCFIISLQIANKHFIHKSTIWKLGYIYSFVNPEPWICASHLFVSERETLLWYGHWSTYWQNKISFKWPRSSKYCAAAWREKKKRKTQTAFCPRTSVTLSSLEHHATLWNKSVAVSRAERANSKRAVAPQVWGLWGLLISAYSWQINNTQPAEGQWRELPHPALQSHEVTLLCLPRSFPKATIPPAV